MAPRISYTQTKLDYPLYAADFDPYGRGYLVVGGGGGEGRNGVGNKITLLDTSSRNTIEKVAEKELSPDEDSVTSLANLASPDGLITFAGINSSETVQQFGRNEHFRAFQVKYPPKRKAAGIEKVEEGKINPISMTSLFKPPSGPKNEKYQRIIRLSPAQKRESGNKRIGAITTGLGTPNELVIFNATTTIPSSFDVIQRVELDSEAADVDIFEEEPGRFIVAYCTDYAVYISRFIYDFDKKKVIGDLREPEKIHTILAGPSRRKLRSLRFLSSGLLLLLVNLPNRTGAELQLLRALSADSSSVVLRKSLPKHVKQAIGLDTVTLDSDPDSAIRQAAIAVAGQDISITVLTIDIGGPKNSFKTVKVLKDVHPLQMTKVLWAPYYSPYSTKEENDKDVKKAGKQYLQLASISMGNTVIVEHVALEPASSKPRARHILPASSSIVDMLDQRQMLLVIGITLLLTLYFFQGAVSANPDMLPASLRPYFVREKSLHVTDTTPDDFALPSARPVALKHARLHDLLHIHKTDLKKGDKAIVVKPSNGEDVNDGLVTEVHEDAGAAIKDKRTKTWEQLSQPEKAVWKRRLSEAGHWTADLPETVLKGVLFSEYAGVIGQLAAGALAGGN